MWSGVVFPTKPDLADILGNMKLDFDNFHLFLGFQISRFLKSGLASAGPDGPSGGPYQMGAEECSKVSLRHA